MSKEQTYEVFRFIEYGTQCRQSLDCVQGFLLIDYLKEYPRVEKDCLFRWFRQLGHLLEQYQCCKKGRCYRYLNPYSVLVMDGNVFLLDLESPENEEALKNMQKRTVSSHFVRPIFERKTDTAVQIDLFCMGKIMQFILSYAEVYPALGRREEHLLRRVIQRCLGESVRNYESFAQLQKALPQVKEKRNKKGVRYGYIVFIGSFAALCIGSVLFISGKDEGTKKEEAVQKDIQEDVSEHMQESGTAQQRAEKKKDETQMDSMREEGQEDKIKEGEESLSTDETEQIVASLKEGLLLNTSAENQEVIVKGKELEAEILRCLAAAYEREEMLLEAAGAYARLCEIEEQPERVEMAGIKKMKLEAGAGQYAQAILTGEELLKKLEDSEEIEALIREYEKEGGKEHNEE